MAKESKLRQKRRDERVFIRIPVRLKAVAHDGGEISESAEAVAVSRFGALPRTTSLLKNGSDLTVTHGFFAANRAILRRLDRGQTDRGPLGHRH